MTAAGTHLAGAPASGPVGSVTGPEGRGRGALTLPARVATLSEPLLRGAPVRAQVVAVFPLALYLVTDRPQAPARDRLVAVVAPGGLLLPGALRVGRLPAGGWPVAVGQPALVGDGQLVLPGLVLELAGVWRPRPVSARPVSSVTVSSGPVSSGTVSPGPVVRHPDGSWQGRSLASLPQRTPALLAAVLAGLTPDRSALAERAAAVVRAALTGSLTPDHVRPLVGLGAGLTPSGDDTLAGALLALAAWQAAPDAAVLDPVYPRTTTLSAALLDHARTGHGVPVLVRLVDAALADDVDATTAALPEVLAIGHSSGGDLLAGLAAALPAARAVIPGQPPPTRGRDR